MSAPALSPAEYDQVRVFGMDIPEPFDDSEGMRTGVEVMGLVVFALLMAGVVGGLVVLGVTLWGLPR